MKALIVVDDHENWPAALAGAEVMSARAYLSAANDERARVINLCRLAGPECPGYYVSLLAAARGQQPLPSAKTIEDVNANPLALSGDIGRLIERVQGTALEVRSYFGCDPNARHDAACRELFAVLQLPLMEARFERRGSGWTLAAVRALATADVPPGERGALVHALRQFVAGRPAIAILHTPGEPLPPSNARALSHFLRAARALGMRAEIIDRHAIDRLPEFDALFMRDTTFLDHYTYDFAQRAAALGLVVIDDPASILQCNNKVYLHELLTRHGIRVPRTMMIHRDNVGEVVRTLGLPCVLKEPGGGFCVGVRKAHDEAELVATARVMLEKSALIIAQEWLPTDFDWRIAVLDRRPLFACKYYMAPGHWQVHKYASGGHVEGRTQCFPIGEAPGDIVHAALRSANLIGDGLYGVDLKHARGEAYVIEINDNPSVEAGSEDQLLQDALYREIMRVFLRRIRERRQALAA